MDTILTPILALIVWTLVIWAWMYATRIPAMQKAGIKPQDGGHPGSLNGLPSEVRRVADNYNHLLEQPTIFYALALYTYLAGHESSLAVTFAWTYVALRVLHSLIQCTVNIVMARFAVFALSTLVLIAWTVLEVMAVL